MSVHWVVLADASRAQIFASDVMLEQLTPIELFEHPESRAKAHDLVAGGRGATHGHDQAIKSRFERHSDPHQATVDAFSRKIADVLMAARLEHRFERLVLVAPPEFLGEVRGHLDRATTRATVISLASDWSQVSWHELPARLHAWRLEALRTVLARRSRREPPARLHVALAAERARAGPPQA